MDCGSEIGDAAKYNRRLAEKKKWQYMGTAQIVMPVHIVWHASAIARRKLSNMERRALENHAIIWIDKCKEILRILFYYNIFMVNPLTSSKELSILLLKLLECR